MKILLKKAWTGLVIGLGVLAMATANAVPSNGDLLITAPGGLVFPETQVGSISTVNRSVVLAVGNGAGTVTFETIGIESPNFTLLKTTDPTNGVCGAAITDTATCTLQVAFTPVASGTRYAELVIRSNAPNAVASNGVLVVPLQGTASKLSQTINPSGFSFSPATLSVGATTTASATASSVLPVTFSSNTPDKCTATGTNGGTITGVGVGTCTIAAAQPGNATYDAASSPTKNITVSPGSETITFGTPLPTISVNGSGTVSATGAPGSTITFTSAPANICTATGTNGSTINGHAAGACRITASHPVSSNYAAASATQDITILGTPQAITGTISFAPATLAVGTTTVASGPTGGASGNPIYFTSITPTKCATSGANGSTITGGPAVGTCTITANQLGNTIYDAVQGALPANITVGMGSQTIIANSFSFSPATLSVSAPTTASATASSGLPVTFSSKTPANCTATGINGGTITGLLANTTCTIAAIQAGNPNYLPSLEVTKDIPVSSTAAPIPATCDASKTLQSVSALQVTLTDTQNKAFSFTPSTSTSGFTIGYPDAYILATISKNACDFTPVETSCWKQGIRGYTLFVYYDGTNPGCQLTAGTPYYLNVRAATYSTTTKTFTPSCGAGKTCSFRPY